MKQVQKIAGAGAQSPNRITLLRDADDDGKSPRRARSSCRTCTRRSAWRWSATTSTSPTPTRCCASPISAGETQITAPGDQGHRPAGRADQPSLDQEPGRQPRRVEALRGRRLQQQRRRERHRGRGPPRRDPRDRPRDRPVARLRFRPAQSGRAGLAAAVRRAVDGGQRARRARRRSRARLHHLGPRRRLLRLAVQLLRHPRRRRGSRRNGPNWSPRPSCPTTRWARTPRRSASPSTRADAFPERYRNGAFVGQHGSWNRSERSGYKVIFVPSRRQAVGPARGYPDRLPQPGRRCARPARRRRGRRRGRPAGRRRCRQRDLAGQRRQWRARQLARGRRRDRHRPGVGPTA